MENLTNIYDFLKGKMPLELCEPWDNSGLLINAEQKIEKVLITLDVTETVVDEAIKENCQLIISHHPVIFKGFKLINNNDIVFKLIRNNISVISMHTNLDVAENGVNDILAKKLGLSNITVSSIGRKGDIEKMTVSSLAELVSRKLNTKVKYTLPEKEISSVAVIGGSAGSYWKSVKDDGCHVLITGEASHHDALDAMHAGVSVIIAGHWNTEVIVLNYLKEILENEFKNIIYMISNSDTDPFEYV